MVILQMSDVELKSLIQDSIKSAIEEEREASLNLPEKLTRVQVANFLLKSPQSVDNYEKRGWIKSLPPEGIRGRMFHKDDVLKLRKALQKK